MEIGHIILVHKDPVHLKRLISRILNGDALIVIHLDLKSDIKLFEDVQSIPGVHFVKNRVSVNWGGFSQVEAVIRSLKELLEIDPSVNYVNLLSGQDYPVRPIASFHDFLLKNPKSSFMEFLPTGHSWTEMAKGRFNRYHLSDSSFFGKYRVERLMDLILPKRSFPENFILTGKSQWFTIDNESAKYVLSVIETNKKLISRFRYSWGADELFFQSILFNSDLKYKMKNDNLRYIDWSERKPSPKILLISDIEKFDHSNYFFARKFDGSVDNKVLDYIDQNILFVG